MARLYLMLDATQNKDWGNFLDAAFAGGVDVVELRADGMPVDEQLDLLKLARTIANHYQGLVVVNDNADLAEKFQADVMHLGAARGPVAAAKTRLHEWALMGRSAHSNEQLDAAMADAEIDYAIVGPIYQPADAPFKTTGLDLIRRANAKHPASEAKPWFAVGGITLDTIDDVIAAGARRIAVGHAIMSAADPKAAAEALIIKLREAWHNDAAMQHYQSNVLGQPSAQLRPDC